MEPDHGAVVRHRSPASKRPSTRQLSSGPKPLCRGWRAGSTHSAVEPETPHGERRSVLSRCKWAGATAGMGAESRRSTIAAAATSW